MNNEKTWKSIFVIGGIAAILSLLGITLDVVMGNITGGDLTELPRTAIERFDQLHQNVLLGLYNLDLLNVIVQIILIPAFFALYAAHKEVNQPFALLSFIVFLFGATLMVSNNVAFSMFELSTKYFNTDIESQRLAYSAAGESLLAQGAHGSPAIFLGFFIPNIANLMLSVVMLKGKIFGRINSWCGIIGSTFMLIYVVLINFNFGMESMATIIAMPGGILLMIWMIMYTIKLIKLSR